MSIRTALNMIVRRPGYFGGLFAVLTLATALACAMFAVADGLMFRPLPFPNADAIVVVDYRQHNGRIPELAYRPELANERGLLRARILASPLVEAAAIHEFTVFFDQARAREVGIRAEGVDETFFAIFGLRPHVGRTLTASDQARAQVPGAALPVVIGYDLWQRAFGGRADALGTQDLAGKAVEVVGVLAPGARFPGETNVWAPTPDVRLAPPRFVRLAAGASASDLENAFDALKVTPLETFVRPSNAGAVPVLLGAAVLLIVAVFVQLSALELVEVGHRAKTVGIQIALGASATDLFMSRALPVGMTVLAASLSGWLVSGAVAQIVIAALPEELVRGQYLYPDGRSAVVAVVLASVLVVCLAAVPAALGRHLRPTRLLSGAVSSSVRGPRRFGLGLVSVQVGATGVLLYLMALAAHSYERAVSFDFGFDPQQAYILTPPRPLRAPRPPGPSDPEQVKVDWAQHFAFKTQIQQTVELLGSVPEVRAAASAFAGPLDFGNGRSRKLRLAEVEILGRTAAPDPVMAVGNVVGPRFLEAIGGTVIVGKSLDDVAYAGREDVALVNESLARLIAPPLQVGPATVQVNVIGQRFWSVSGTKEIVGVTKDMLDSKLGVPSLPEYTSIERDSKAAAVIVARIPGRDREAAIDLLQQAVSPIWGRLDRRHFRALIDELDPVLKPYEGQAVLLAAVVLCCLPIALVGLGASVTTLLGQRSQEFAIRVVLGATPNALRWRLAESILRPAVAGLLVAFAVGALMAKSAGHVMFGVQALDPISMLVAGAIILAAVAGVVSLVLRTWSERDLARFVRQ
jgi:putative ABC transport system permease protein